jgi:hypothetical protein
MFFDVQPTLQFDDRDDTRAAVVLAPFAAIDARGRACLA